MNDEKYLEIISEILQEVSLAETSFGVVYFKHLLQSEQRKLLSQKNIIRSEAKKMGLVTEDQALLDAIKIEMWSEEEESKIKELNEKIESLTNILGQLKLPSKRKLAQREFDKCKKELNLINHEKNKILGLTLEKYVENKLQRMIIEKILFSDKELKESVFKDLYVGENLKEAEAYKIQRDFFKKFSDENISKAVLSNHFSMYLPFAEDVIGIFGKPLKDLTIYQVKLLSFARYFLNIFKNCSKKIPENIAKDPELLISFYESSREDGKNSGQSRTGSGGSTHVGATKSDMQAIKRDNEDVVYLAEEMEKRGGSLNMKQMMELHGV